MEKPVLLIVNGLPGTGKTTLAGRLAADVRLPVFSRDDIYENLYDALECHRNGIPPLIGAAAFSLLYSIAGPLLAAGQSLIVEQFFGRPELRGAEFRRLQQAHDFEPIEILCKADGEVLLERILARHTRERRHGHQDREWIEHNREWLLQGRLTPLALGDQVIEIDTTTPERLDYADVLQRVRAVLLNRVTP